MNPFHHKHLTSLLINYNAAWKVIHVEECGKVVLAIDYSMRSSSSFIHQGLCHLAGYKQCAARSKSHYLKMVMELLLQQTNEIHRQVLPIKTALAV